MISMTMSTSYKLNKGLLDCHVIKESDFPLVQEEDNGNGRNVSAVWYIMFLISLGKVIIALIQMLLRATVTKESCLPFIWYFTVFYLLVNTAIFVWFHIERWSHSGKVCSGDYLSDEDYDKYRTFWMSLPDSDSSDLTQEEDLARRYLLLQGNLLKWWIIANWIGIFLLGCCFTCCFWVFKGILPNRDYSVERE